MPDDLVYIKILKYCRDEKWRRMKLTNHHISILGKKCENRLKKRLEMEININKQIWKFYSNLEEKYRNATPMRNSCEAYSLKRQIIKKNYFTLFFMGLSAGLIYWRMDDVIKTISEGSIIRKILPYCVGGLYGVWYILYEEI